MSLQILELLSSYYEELLSSLPYLSGDTTVLHLQFTKQFRTALPQMESDTSLQKWVKEELLQIRKWRSTKLIKVTQFILLFCSLLKFRAAHILRSAPRMSTGICWLRKSMALISSILGTRSVAWERSLGLCFFGLQSSNWTFPIADRFWNVSA